MKGTTLALLTVFLAAILGSAVVPLIKIGLQTIPPFAFTLLRFVIALVFILPIFLREKPKIKNINPAVTKAPKILIFFRLQRLLLIKEWDRRGVGRIEYGIAL